MGVGRKKEWVENKESSRWDASMVFEFITKIWVSNQMIQIFLIKI
jgi:hypothetical protein